MHKNVWLVIFLCIGFNLTFASENTNINVRQNLYTYKIIKKYPHSIKDFTEGFIYENGVIYESTGQYGESQMKKYKLGSGEPIKVYNLPMMYFGEGAVILGENVYQLTWKSRVGFIYNKDLEFTGNFNYRTRGWGITTDRKYLIMSDGTNKLYYLNPKNFMEEKIIQVYDGESPVVNINELEYVNGKIFANVFMTNLITIIDPKTGAVEGWIDLTGILDNEILDKPVDVLNGIAYNDEKNTLLVTGKYWPYIFEIQLIEQK